jgi:hypothetical protein
MPFGLGFFATTGAGAAAGAYELIQSQVLSSTTTSVTFSSIPSTFRHLQIRISAKTAQASTGVDTVRLRLNGDSGSNYAIHGLSGNGSSVSSFAVASHNLIAITGGAVRLNDTNMFGAAVVDILDYVSTAKNTTVRSLGGAAASTNSIDLNSGLWMNTAAVTSLTLSAFTDFVSGSRFSLYGLRG